MLEYSSNEKASSTGRRAVLDALRAFAGPVTIPALAERTALHTNTVRFHLSKLVQTGLVREEPGESNGPGRPRLRYRLTSSPAVRESQDEGGSDEYQLLSQILASYLASHSDDPMAEAESAGRQWGHYLVERPAPFERVDHGERLARVTAMLRKLGFAPEADNSGEIKLHRCPFRAVAERQPTVVCSMHRGLIQGALDELGAGSAFATLQPFVTDRLCVAHLAATPGPSTAPGSEPPAEPDGTPRERRRRPTDRESGSADGR